MESRVNFSDDKLIVNADARKLVRAFENLLSNAIKYGQDGFYVDVTTKVEEKMAVVQVVNYGQSIKICQFYWHCINYVISTLNVMAKKITRKYKVVEITYIMTAIGFLSFNVLSVADHIVKNTLITYFKPFSSLVFLISVFYLGILSSLITSLLSNYTLSKIDASKMSVFIINFFIL